MTPEEFRTIIREEIQSFDSFLNGIASDISLMKKDIKSVNTCIDKLDETLSWQEEKLSGTIGELCRQNMSGVLHDHNIEKHLKAIERHLKQLNRRT